MKTLTALGVIAATLLYTKWVNSRRWRARVVVPLPTLHQWSDPVNIATTFFEESEFVCAKAEEMLKMATEQEDVQRLTEAVNVWTAAKEAAAEAREASKRMLAAWDAALNCSLNLQHH